MLAHFRRQCPLFALHSVSLSSFSFSPFALPIAGIAMCMCTCYSVCCFLLLGIMWECECLCVWFRSYYFNNYLPFVISHFSASQIPSTREKERKESRGQREWGGRNSTQPDSHHAQTPTHAHTQNKPNRLFTLSIRPFNPSAYLSHSSAVAQNHISIFFLGRKWVEWVQ